MISVTVLTKNNETTIGEVLDALIDFPEVIVFDTGSSDQTLAIAKKYPNVAIHQGVLKGFGPTHNLASSLAKHDWILSIDSDEVLTESLVKEIQELNLSPTTCFAIARKNFYNGKWIRYCSWWPDYQVKLYNKTRTHYNDLFVHESIITQGMRVKKLKHPLKHTSYTSLEDFLAKMQTYSTLFANENQGKSSSPMKALSRALWTFFKCYFLKKGLLGGYEGFLISCYNAQTTFYKYLKLYELNNKLKTFRCPEEKGSSSKLSVSTQE